LPLAKALDMTRFEVYESYLDEEYTNNRAKRLRIKKLGIDETGVGRVAAGWLGGWRAAWPCAVARRAATLRASGTE
jgi:hypothetical protein